MKEEPRKASEELKEWLEKNCAPGEKLLIRETSTSFTIEKGPFFSYNY